MPSQAGAYKAYSEQHALHKPLGWQVDKGASELWACHEMAHDHWPFETALYSDRRLPALALEEVFWLARHPFGPQNCFPSKQVSLKVYWPAHSSTFKGAPALG